MDTVTDQEVIKVMMDGGRRLCDYARAQWTSGKYGLDHDTNYENVRRWNEIEHRISTLGALLKETVRGSTT